MKIWLIPIIAILAIAGLELFAMARGIDGAAAALAFAAIGSIATGGIIKIWGKLKAKGFHAHIGGEQK
ncbi:hypothetical protein ES708_11982 [subsurface metagenome]